MKGWLDNFGKADNANDSNVSLPEGFVGLGYDTKGRNYSPAWGGQFAMGGSIPGSVGFTYARVAGAAPSKGKYAKKTMASAQKGKQVQKGVDSTLENIFEVVDPTGISSWDDVYNSYQKSGMSPETKFEIFGALPILGKVGKAGKLLGPALSAGQANKRLKTNANLVSNVMQSIPYIGRGTDATQAVQQFSDVPFFPTAPPAGVGQFGRYAGMPSMDLEKKQYGGEIPSAQNGQEMRFYQNGLDWKPKSMQDGGVQRISTSDPRYPELYKNRQVGAYYDGAFTLPDLPEVTVTAPRSYTMDSLRDFTTAALYGAPANAMKLSMIPQAAMTEGIEALRGEPYDFSNVNPNFGGFTSNQRDLSQTMGYENPEGFLQNAVNFGLSAIDPMILSGASKVVGKQLARKAVPEFIPEKIVFDLMDESIDPFAQVLKNIKIHDTPSPFAKDVQKEAFKYQKLARDPRYLERVKNIDRDFGSRLEPLLNEFKNDEIQNVNQYFPFNISIVDEIPHSFGGEPVDVLGISGLNTEGSLKNAMNKGVKYPQKITPSTDRYIEINEPRHLRENTPARGTVHHELKHHWTNALLDAENKNYEQALRNLIARRSEAGIDPRDVAANQDYNYLSRGTEVDAHLMTNLRDEMVKRGYLKDHFDELSEGKLNDFLSKEKDYRGVREYFNPLKPMVTDKSKFVDFFNKYGLPSTVIGGVLGGQAIDQQKNGGITKDNQGYWNPENWGKPVEIDSNNITMEGVNQPLLGISDTGDAKLMKPGKNYKFKGKKVTEFPVAKLGINQLDAQPMKKLNQLLNFTNNPDKDNWLDKYN